MKVTLNLTEEQVNEITSEKIKALEQRILDLQKLRVEEHNELMNLLNEEQAEEYHYEYICKNCRYFGSCQSRNHLCGIKCIWTLEGGKIVWHGRCGSFKED